VDGTITTTCFKVANIKQIEYHGASGLDVELTIDYGQLLTMEDILFAEQT